VGRGEPRDGGRRSQSWTLYLLRSGNNVCCVWTCKKLGAVSIDRPLPGLVGMACGDLWNLPPAPHGQPEAKAGAPPFCGVAVTSSGSDPVVVELRLLLDSEAQIQTANPTTFLLVSRAPGLLTSPRSAMDETVTQSTIAIYDVAHCLYHVRCIVISHTWVDRQ
jgi:hypothetical protein